MKATLLALFVLLASGCSTIPWTIACMPYEYGEKDCIYENGTRRAWHYFPERRVPITCYGTDNIIHCY